MGGNVIELIGQPIEYERQKEFEQIKQGVIGSFLERTENTINEKREYCLKNGLSLDQANYIITKAIQKLSSLVPLKNEDKNLDELLLLRQTQVPATKLPDWPPKDSEVPANGYSL